MLRLLQCRERTGREALMLGLQLLQYIEPRTGLRLLLENLVLLFRNSLEFTTKLNQPLLAFLYRPALRLRVELLLLDIDRKFMQARFEPRALFFKLDFFR